MKLLESGSFGGKYAYVKLKFSDISDNTLVIFPPTQELNFPIRINPDLQIKRYKSLIPRDVVGNLYILGYDPHISTDTFLVDVADDSFWIEAQGKVVGAEQPRLLRLAGKDNNRVFQFIAALPELLRCRQHRSDGGAVVYRAIKDLVLSGKILAHPEMIDMSAQ